jgi:hypothetical protein
VIAWLEEIVTTLPKSCRRGFELFFVRDLRNSEAARALGVPEKRASQLRYLCRRAIVEAFAANVLAVDAVAPNDAVPADMTVSGETRPRCPELLEILQEAEHTGRVLPRGLRREVSKHVKECPVCQDRRDVCLPWWTSALVPVLVGTGALRRRVMERIRLVSDSTHAGESGDDTAAGPDEPTGNAPNGSHGMRKVAVAAVAVLLVLLISAVRPWRFEGTVTAAGAVVPGSAAPSRLGSAPSSQPPASTDATDVGDGATAGRGEPPSPRTRRATPGQPASASPVGSSPVSQGQTPSATAAGTAVSLAPQPTVSQSGPGPSATPSIATPTPTPSPAEPTVPVPASPVPEPVPPPLRTLVIHISQNSDAATVAEYGVAVSINGKTQAACTGLGANCPYQAHDGDVIRILDHSASNEFPPQVYSWGSGVCASAPLDGPCVFTVTGDIPGFNLDVQ